MFCRRLINKHLARFKKVIFLVVANEAQNTSNNFIMSNIIKKGWLLDEIKGKEGPAAKRCFVQILKAAMEPISPQMHKLEQNYHCTLARHTSAAKAKGSATNSPAESPQLITLRLSDSLYFVKAYLTSTAAKDLIAYALYLL